MTTRLERRVAQPEAAHGKSGPGPNHDPILLQLLPLAIR
jgi:hypothetical protein